MATYAVFARIDRVDPHLAGWASVPAATSDSADVEPLDASEAVDLAGRPDVPTLAERWAGLREAWAQTTFYLLHAEGWR